MRFQTSFTSPQYLPLGDCLLVYFERGGRLEAAHHSEANFAGNSEIAERRAEHRESCPAVTAQSLQKQQRRVPEESESLCSQF
jgi:hypothetical protein